MKKLKPTKLWATITPAGEVTYASAQKRDVLVRIMDHYQLIKGRPTCVGRDRVVRVLLTEVPRAS